VRSLFALRGVGVVLAVLALVAPASAQQIVLDRGRAAGKFWLFPIAGDPHSYLYAVAQAQLARHPNGRPVFSFLRFVENVMSEGGSNSLVEATGGGIVHAAVQLGLPEEQRKDALAEAQRALQQIDPSGKIVGAASYTSGQFMLTTAFQEEDESKGKSGKGGKWVEKVVGMGEAPILEGGKASISMRLTKDGAKVLWQSFHTSTPAINFVFNMQLDGVNSPIQAKLKVNWERAYENQKIQVGVAAPMTQIDVDLAFEELRQQGAISLTEIGDDAEMHAIVKDAYEKVRDLMFDKTNGLIAQKPGAAVAGSGGKTPAERAEALRASRKTEREGRATHYKAEADAQQTRADAARKTADQWSAKAAQLRAKVGGAESAASGAVVARDTSGDTPTTPTGAPVEPPKETATPPKNTTATPANAPPTDPPKTAGTPAPEPPKTTPANPPAQELPKPAGTPPAKEPPKPTPASPPAKDPPKTAGTPPAKEPPKTTPANPPAKEPPKPAGTPPAKEPPKTTTTPPNTGSGKDQPTTEKEIEAALKDLSPEEQLAFAEEKARSLSKVADDEEKKLAELRKKQKESDESVDSVVQDEFALALSYMLKKERQTLDFEFDFNKYRSSNRKVKIDENIGDLRSLLDDDSVFRSVNLDDPMYKQREIAVSVDGSNEADFKKYINYVTVQLRKKHEGGDDTIQDVRIDRQNFSTNANDFRLLYGWKGDNDRAAWFDYQYRTVWSFFGGSTVSGDWIKATEGTIPINSPYERREVELDGDPDSLAAAKVRAVVFTLYYDLGGVERTEKVTLKTAKGELNRKVEFIAPVGSYKYDYEILWMLPGNKSVSSGRQPNTSPVLSIDYEPPDAGA
jgi:hypothetical protein